MSDAPLYSGFLGTWILIPESCDYQQSEPPQSGTYRIEETAEGLRFEISWTDRQGEEHSVSFSGVPDGQLAPFDGGDLADAMAIRPVSRRELNTSAYFRGKELMVVQRQLDDSGQAMRVIQLVRLPDGTTMHNTAIYRRQVIH